MSDSNAPVEEPQDALIRRNEHGDPVSLGTRMIEREAYENVIEGLKAAADGAHHCASSIARFVNAGSEYAAAPPRWLGIAERLDKARRAAMEMAGIEEPMRHERSRGPRGEPMSYLAARMRFRDGLKRAEGGCRQLAVCFRGELLWSKLGAQLAQLAAAAAEKRSRIIRPDSPLFSGTLP